MWRRWNERFRFDSLRAPGEVLPDGTLLEDFRTEYAKCGRAKCRACYQNIAMAEVRISKKDRYDDRRYGPLDMWYHLECFAENWEELEFFCSGDQLAGFKALTEEDQEEIATQLPKPNRGRK